MAIIYLTEQGSVIRKIDRRLVVTKQDKALVDVPLIHVERVIVLGNVQLTTQAMVALMENGTNVAFLSTTGKYRGQLTPRDSLNSPLRLKQYARSQEQEFCMDISKKIVAAKLKNAKVQVRRYRRNHPETDFSSELNILDQALKTLPTKTTTDELLGVEGYASRAWFSAMGKMHTKLQFTGRNRRPPKDPVNAMLSLGYVMLTNELTGAISAVGLDPYIGYLHSTHHGRPSLSLDLAEEFRHPVIDMLVLDVANRNRIRSSDFTLDGDSCRLTQTALATFIKAYEARLTTCFKDRRTGKHTTYRKLLLNQSSSLARAIEGSEYQPFRP